MSSHERMLRALHRLTRWRTVFAGWQLGTRTDTDPEAQAVRDHVESRLIVRAELTALVRLSIEAGRFTQEQYENAVAVEADLLCEALADRFPGFWVDQDAGHLMIDPKIAAETSKGWRP